MRRLVLAFAVLLLPALAVAQIPRPNLPGIEIPGLGSILKQKPPLTTTPDDARTGAPFLDDFDPEVAYSMAHLPLSPNAGYVIVAPGVLQLDARSYCLNAGAHGPREGDGYLYAPLKGPWASIIRNVLRNSMYHGEIAQHDIQALLWAILARTKISDLSAELQQVAAQLLKPEEILKINGGALGLIPEDLWDKAFGRLPPFARQMVEAQARLRDMFADGTASFDELEAVAVLTGEAPLLEGEREVPTERWSYHPGGYFIRYFIYGYNRTVTQVYVPEPFQVEADEEGRMTAIASSDGDRIEMGYDDTIEPVAIPGERLLRGHAFSLIRLTRRDPENPDETHEAEWTDKGWTFAGLPSRRGRVGQEEGRFADLSERYQQVKEHSVQLTQLVREIQRLHPGRARGQELQTALQDITSIAHCAMAVRAALGDALPDEQSWVPGCLNLLEKAWATRVCELAAPSGQPEAHAPHGASLPVTALAMAPTDAQQTAGARSYQARVFGAGLGGWVAGAGNGSGAGLPDFDPSGGVGTGTKRQQPTGESGKPFGEVVEAGKKAQKAIGLLRKGKMIADVAASPMAGASSIVGFAIPKQMFAQILDFNICKWSEAIAALAGEDPPRQDYTTIATPETIIFTPLQPGPDMPAGRAAALNSLMAAVCELTSQLRAGSVSVDRYQGALAADDTNWAYQQARAIVRYKRQSGVAMIPVADRLKALLHELRAEGFDDIAVMADSLRDYQTRIRTQGFSPDELAAARAVGLSDAEIEAERQERIAADPDEVAGSLFEAAEQLASGLGDLGAQWASLPPVLP